MRPAPRRVLIINTGSVFDTSLFELLKAATDLEVIQVPDREETGLRLAVAHYRPHTIIINDSEEDGAIPQLKVLTDLPFIQRLRIVVVRLTDNAIVQYDIRQIVATESADLVALIRSE